MQQISPEEHLEIAEKVRTGEYFREARSMYDLTIHDPMSERYLYLVITGLALMILIVAGVAARALYPLQTAVPFIVDTNNVVEDWPHIQTLLTQKGEDPSEALLSFMLSNYVTMREEYDIETFDRNISGVQSQSSPAVFQTFQQDIDPRNPDSPVTLYQRHAQRSIEILYLSHVSDSQYPMAVVFDATVEDKGEVKKSRWQANIAFNYSRIALDEKTGRVAPISFMVTRYRATRIQDVQ